MQPQRNILEDPARGYLLNDTIIIKYTIELVVSSGGALSRNQHPNRGELIKAPLPTLGKDLGELYRSGEPLLAYNYALPKADSCSAMLVASHAAVLASACAVHLLSACM